MISPWSVARYRSEAEADNYTAKTLLPDMAAAKAMGKAYLPVIFPGYSQSNRNVAQRLAPVSVNQIPRDCGLFYWRQVVDNVSSGANMLYGAMFDEADEGTSMFKAVPTADGAPVDGQFLTLDADGCKLPSGWYLGLSGAANSVLQGRAPLTTGMQVTDPGR